MTFYEVKKLIKRLKEWEDEGVELLYSDNLQEVIDSAIYEPKE
jgi:hypothetical protein